MTRRAFRPGDGLHPADTRNVEDALGDSVDDQHVRRIAHIMVGLDEQHLRVHPGLREVPVGRRVADVGRDVLGEEEAVVVARLVRRKCQQTDQSQSHRRGEDGSRPPHHGGADPAPAAGLHRPLRIEQAEAAADGQQGGRHGQRRCDGDEHADRQRNAERLEVGQPREVQAERRTRDGQTRAQDDVGGAVIHRVERGFAVLAVIARLVIAADKEDRIVRSSRDSQRGE